MSEPKPNRAPGGPLSGMEPAAGVGIWDQMQDLALFPRPEIRTTPEPDAPEFDAWLRRHLARLHSGVLAEPVPERLLRLLDHLQG